MYKLSVEKWQGVRQAEKSFTCLTIYKLVPKDYLFIYSLSCEFNVSCACHTFSFAVETRCNSGSESLDLSNQAFYHIAKEKKSVLCSVTVLYSSRYNE